MVHIAKTLKTEVGQKIEQLISSSVAEHISRPHLQEVIDLLTSSNAFAALQPANNTKDSTIKQSCFGNLEVNIFKKFLFVFLHLVKHFMNSRVNKLMKLHYNFH